MVQAKVGSLGTHGWFNDQDGTKLGDRRGRQWSRKSKVLKVIGKKLKNSRFSYTTSEALLKNGTMIYVRNTLPAPPSAAPLSEVPSWANTEVEFGVYDDEEDEMFERPDSTKARKRRASTPPG